VRETRAQGRIQSPQLGADLRFEVAGRQPAADGNQRSAFRPEGAADVGSRCVNIEMTLAVQRARKEIIGKEPCASYSRWSAQMGFGGNGKTGLGVRKAASARAGAALISRKRYWTFAAELTELLHTLPFGPRGDLKVRGRALSRRGPDFWARWRKNTARSNFRRAANG
jgi:hypothetical protein